MRQLKIIAIVLVPLFILALLTAFAAWSAPDVATAIDTTTAATSLPQEPVILARRAISIPFGPALPPLGG